MLILLYHIFRQSNFYFEVSVMRQADALTKEYLSNNEIFADVFNYLIYDGQQRILPENLIERDTSEITLPLGKRGELATIQKIFEIFLKGCIAKEYKKYPLCTVLELRINLISIMQCLSKICSMMRLIILHK